MSGDVHVRFCEGPGVRFPRATRHVMCCRGPAKEAERAMRSMMQKLKLTVNEEKTHICRIPDETFDFLGYTFGRCYSPKTGRAYIGARPSRKKIRGICREISEITSARWGLMTAEDRTERLNRLLRGWANYFCLGPVSKAYRAVDAHVRRRLRQWLCRKHKTPGQGTARYPDTYLDEQLQLLRLAPLTASFPWAKA